MSDIASLIKTRYKGQSGEEAHDRKWGLTNQNHSLHHVDLALDLPPLLTINCGQIVTLSSIQLSFLCGTEELILF